MKYIATAILACGAWLSLRMAWADYRGVELDSASYWLRMANLHEMDGAVDRALALNPRYAQAWIDRALREEIRGHTAEAERDYLTAARVDHMYKPAWALANFYIRRDNRDKFWTYGRRCLEVVEPRRLEPASYDPAPVFNLAWQVSRDAGEIRTKLIPPRHFILADYLEYLRAHDHLDAGVDVALDLARYGDAGDTYDLLNFCEQLINFPKTEPAVRIWNAMIERKTVRSERLDARQGASLSNGELRRPFLRAGFDWRMPDAEGVIESHFTDSGEVRFEFSGDQPESVLVLHQSVPVVGGARYRISSRFRSPDLDNSEGLDWEVWDYAGQREIAVSGSVEQAEFAAPRNVSMVRIGVVCRRVTGSTRIHGTAVLSDLRLMRM